MFCTVRCPHLTAFLWIPWAADALVCPVKHCSPPVIARRGVLDAAKQSRLLFRARNNSTPHLLLEMTNHSPGDSMRRFNRPTLAVLLITLLCASPIFAIGSAEKTPEEKASDDSRKATKAYNDGVRRIDHAKEIGLKGDSAYAYNYRATSDAKARREYEKAVKDFTKAIELNPQMKEAHNNLGYCYRKLGKLTESLASYDDAIALDSNFAQAREYRAETYLALGQLSKAERELLFLQKLKSPYADQLNNSIELFKLAEIDRAAKTNGK